MNKPELYIRLSFDGSHCVMQFNEGLEVIKDSEEDYDVDTVVMTRKEFEALPEFTGF